MAEKKKLEKKVRGTALRLDSGILSRYTAFVFINTTSR